MERFSKETSCGTGSLNSRAWARAREVSFRLATEPPKFFWPGSAGGASSHGSITGHFVSCTSLFFPEQDIMARAEIAIAQIISIFLIIESVIVAFVKKIEDVRKHKRDQPGLITLYFFIFIIKAALIQK